MYKIIWKNSATKEVRKLQKNVRTAVLNAVEKLAENPKMHGVIKLVNSERSYRYRVGDYRIVFDIHDENISIEVIKVKHRKDVYR